MRSSENERFRRTEFLKQLFQTRPALQQVAERICRRYANRGALTGTMKIGQGADREFVHGVQTLFSLESVRISGKGDVRVEFDRFFADNTATERQQWIDALHAAAGIEERNRKTEQQDQTKQVRTMQERLRLSYPSLAAIHNHLDRERQRLCNRLDRMSADALQKMHLQACAIVEFLLSGQTVITFSELGARFCKDSKAMRDTELTTLVRSWLTIMAGEEESRDVAEEPEEFWQRYHVVKDRMAVQAVLFGPLIYEKEGRRFDWIYRLWQIGEAAVLSWQNIVAIERIFPAEEVGGGYELITCENEAPFGGLVRDGHQAVLLYTCGFPNDSVLALYRLLAPHAGECKHWGDSDLAGLRIASLLHALHPLKLWRCDLSSLERMKLALLPLPPDRRQEAERFLTSQPDFPFQAELAYTLRYGWLEQESWSPF